MSGKAAGLFEKPAKPMRFRKLSRFSAKPGFEAPKGGVRQRLEASDEYGLSIILYRYVSPMGRKYIARALEHLGLAKDVPPTEQHTATIPELVIYGGLLERGFIDQTVEGMGGQGSGPRGFVFRKVWFMPQSGARVAEVDFSVYQGNEVIAVMVNGAFHRADHPAGIGGEAMAKDRRQWQQLGATRVTRVVTVNQNFELERGASFLVERDFHRILGRL